MEILQAEQIRKSFDGNEVLKGISISVNKGRKDEVFLKCFIIISETVGKIKGFCKIFLIPIPFACKRGIFALY